MDAAIIVEFFSAGPSDFSDMAYSSCRSLIYACLVLATPMRAFVHDVSPGLASLVRRFVNFVFVRLRRPGAGNTGACLRPRCVPGLGKPAATRRQQHFFRAHHYFDTTAPMTNLAPPCARGSTATSSTPATLTQHRPRHSSHGYLDHRSEEQRLNSSHDSAMRRLLRLCVCVGGGPSACLRILLQSHCLCRYRCHCGGMLSIIFIRKDEID